MERKSNYFKIGLFVLCALAILLAGLFVLGARSMFQKKWLVETYFDNSVQGLEVGSPVKYLGVEIGAVKEIGFVAETYDTDMNYARVVIAAAPGMLGISKSETQTATQKNIRSHFKQEVDQGYRISIMMQGVTGSSYLETEYQKNAGKQSETLEIDWDPKHPYIPSAQGTIRRIGNSMEKVLDELEAVPFQSIGKQTENAITTFNSLLTNDFKSTLASLNRAATRIPAEMKYVRTEFNQMINEDIHPILTNLQASATELPGTVGQLKSVARRADRWSTDNQADLSEVVANMRRISENFRDISDRAKEYPSHIIFGDAPPQSKSIEQE